MKWLVLHLVVLGVLLCCQSCCRSRLAGFAPHGELTGEVAFGEYKIKTYRSDEDGKGSFEILREGARVLGAHGYKFDIGQYPYAEDSLPRGLIGKDINGDRTRDIVIWEWTGGAHCCFIAHVIELDGNCRILAEINGQHGVPQFKDLDGDGVLEILRHDWTYQYWPGCFAYSPAPQVILRWQAGEYVVAPDLMKRPLSSEAELRAKAKAIRASTEWDEAARVFGPSCSGYSRWSIPKELFQTALDLMYAGHEERGWSFITEAWCPHYEVDEELIDELRWRLAHSPFWREFKQMSNQRM